MSAARRVLNRSKPLCSGTRWTSAQLCALNCLCAACGPIARDVTDLRLLRSVIGGACDEDWNVAPASRADADVSLAGLRVAVSPTLGGVPIDGERRPYGDALAMYTCPIAVMGCPAVALPLGLGARSGLPVGVQIVGRRWTDARLLAIAEAVEGVVGRLPAP